MKLLEVVSLLALVSRSEAVHGFTIWRMDQIVAPDFSERRHGEIKYGFVFLPYSGNATDPDQTPGPPACADILAAKDRCEFNWDSFPLDNYCSMKPGSNDYPIDFVFKIRGRGFYTVRPPAANSDPHLFLPYEVQEDVTQGVHLDGDLCYNPGQVTSSYKCTGPDGERYTGALQFKCATEVLNFD